MKKFISGLLALLIVTSMAVVSVCGADTSSEATGTSGKIYFDASKWNNVTQIYCHIWINGGAKFFGWKLPQEKCTNVSGSLWEYDLSILDESTEIEGGLKADEDYCLIFHADTGVQGYDTTFGLECIGDRAYTTDKQIENPMDSEKKGYETLWSKNSSKYGPHLAISSIGNFLGTVLCPNESGTKVIGDWLIAYSGSQYCDPVEVLSKALPKFGVKDITTVMAYINTKDTGISDPKKMQSQLEEAYEMAYGVKETIDEKELEEKQKQIEENDGNTDGVSEDEPKETVSNLVEAKPGTEDLSGTGADGQNNTNLIILAFIMLVATGVFIVCRKKKEL